MPDRKIPSTPTRLDKPLFAFRNAEKSAQSRGQQTVMSANLSII
jgi:hypothetical protein